MNKVTVVVPIYRIPQTPEERQSLIALSECLDSHQRVFVCPKSLRVPSEFLKGEQLIRLPDRFFTYPDGYNRMLMSSSFYKAFERFQHILIYQLDCLVFRDELDAWCAKDYDYIGSPWRDNYSDDSSEASWKVGNGGFSLRKVSTALRVLRKRIKRGEIYPVPPPYRPRPGFWKWLFENTINRLKQHLNLWTVEDELQNYRENEDRWWSIDVLKVVSDYKKPTVEEALRFGFEVEPRECLKLTGGKLPFGCHAWWKQDRGFWEGVLKQQKLV